MPSQFARFFDEYNPSWNKTAEYNLLFLRGQQAHANDLLHARGYLFLNEVYVNFLLLEKLFKSDCRYYFSGTFRKEEFI